MKVKFSGNRSLGRITFSGMSLGQMMCLCRLIEEEAENGGIIADEMSVVIDNELRKEDAPEYATDLRDYLLTC